MKYIPRGVCSRAIDIEVKDGIIESVKFTGGCNGNLQAIPKLVEGMTVDEVVSRISGISCNGRGTSCGDQLAKALTEAYAASQA